MLSEASILEIARDLLKDTLDVPVDVQASASRPADGELIIGDARFLVEVKNDARSSSIGRAINQLGKFKESAPQANLLLVVPRMSPAGEALCRRAGVNWLDLDGNADIQSDRLLVRVRGLRRRLAHPVSANGGGLNPFSQRASRIAEVLLSDPDRTWTRADLRSGSKLDNGFVSKVLAELIGQGLIVEEVGRGRIRNVRVKNPMVLLDAWSERYKPRQPSVWGLLAARDGFEAASRVSNTLKDGAIGYALTGLPAAAQYANFGTFRRVDVYVSQPLPESVRSKLHVGPDLRGRNVAITIDERASTFDVRERERHRLASPVRVYLDLASLPERAAEAREEMRRFLEIQWK